MKTNILLEDKRWLDVPLEEISKIGLQLIIDKCLGKDNKFEVSILASNDEEIKALNKNFRGKNGSTNILSWPEHELQPKSPGELPKQLNRSKFNAGDLVFLGNLAISFERCSIESWERKINIKDHILHLLIHGYLHLVGFDHQNELDASLMEGIEIKLLSGVGIKNPYELNDQ